MARKFKKHLAQKQTRSKVAAVLSVNITGKEYLEKLNKTWKKVLDRLKNFKLRN